MITPSSSVQVLEALAVAANHLLICPHFTTTAAANPTPKPSPTKRNMTRGLVYLHSTWSVR